MPAKLILKLLRLYLSMKNHKLKQVGFIIRIQCFSASGLTQNKTIRYFRGSLFKHLKRTDSQLAQW